jgi:hypothetical protein
MCSHGVGQLHRTEIEHKDTTHAHCFTPPDGARKNHMMYAPPTPLVSALAPAAPTPVAGPYAAYRSYAAIVTFQFQQ